MTNEKDLAQRLRAAVNSVRRKSAPLSELIPLMQQAADALEKVALAVEPIEPTQKS
jgi:hypothetical protein